MKRRLLVAAATAALLIGSASAATAAPQSRSLTSLRVAQVQIKGGAFLPWSQPMMGQVLAQQTVNPNMHTCDDPGSPCYTEDQMNTYWAEHSHGFLELDKDFVFPKAFVQAAVAAHQQAVDAGLMPQQDAASWWSGFRDDIHCAGGTGDIFWSCPGGHTQQVRDQMYLNLSHTTEVNLICGGIAAFAFWRGGLWGALGTGGPCFTHNWWNLP